MKSYLILGIAIMLNSFAHFFLKNGAVIKELSFTKLKYLGGGLGCFGVSVIFYTLALSKLKLSTAFPLSLGFGAVITSLLAAFFLSENMGVFFYVGLMLIMVGTYCITILN